MIRRILIKIIVYFFLITNLACTSTFAENPLTWQECQLLAQKNNWDLIIAREKVEEYKLAKESAKSEKWPQVGAGAALKQAASGETGTSYSEPENINYSKNLSLSGRQIIFDGDRLKYSTALAEEKLTNQKYSCQITEANVRLNVRRYFCEVLRAQELIALSKVIVTRREQQLDMVTLRYNAGLEHKGSYLTAKANLTRAISEQEQARRHLETYQYKLAAVLGITPNNQLVVTGDLSLASDYKSRPDFPALVKTTPLLQEIISSRIQSQYSLNLKKIDYLPEAYLSASLGRSQTTIDNKNTDNDSWSIGANIDFSLLDGGKRNNELDKAENQLKQSEHALENNKQSIVLILQENWIKVLNAVDNITIAQEYLTAREERATIASAQYSSGLISFDNWIIIEDDLINAQNNYINAKIDSLIKEAEWINAQGGGFNEK